MSEKLRDAFGGIKAEEALKEKTLKRLQEERQRKKAKRSYLLKPTAAVIISMMVIIFGANMYFSVEAAIDIDINPSMEIKINRFMRVTSAYGYNEEGELVLSGLKLSNKKLDEAITEVLTETEKKGYTTGTDLLTMTVFSSSLESAAGIKAEAEKAAAGYAHGHHGTKYNIYSIDEKTKGEAAEYSLTPAKYLAALELKNYEPDLDLSSCSSQSINEINEQVRCHSGESHAHAHGHCRRQD